jgi:hypothetical protein
MVVVPADTAVTTPEELIVATPKFDEVHGVVASAVPEPVKVVVELKQIPNVPEIVGVGFTTTAIVALGLSQDVVGLVWVTYY